MKRKNFTPEVQDEIRLVGNETLFQEQFPTVQYKNVIIPAETLAKLIKGRMIGCALEGVKRRGSKEYRNLETSHAAILYGLFKKLAEACDLDPVEEILTSLYSDEISTFRLFLDPALHQNWLDYVANHKEEVSRLYPSDCPSEWVSVMEVDVPKSLLSEAVGVGVVGLVEKCYNIILDAEQKGYNPPRCISKLRRDSIVGSMLETVLNGNAVRGDRPTWIELWTIQDWKEAYQLFIVDKKA